MPRGQPDYGLYTQTLVASGISDPGEAAARLGAINVYDRRGWTVWMDDFEAPGLKWLPVTAGEGAAPVLSAVNAWVGVQSAYLYVGAATEDHSGIRRYFPLVRRGRLGIEFWTNLLNHLNAYLQLYVTIADGANFSTAILRLDRLARTATIVTPAEDIIVATYWCPSSVLTEFIPVKLVVDMDTDRYTRLMIGPEEVDLSAHLLVPLLATTDKLLHITLELLGSASGTGYAYIDNFILTQNEP